MSFDTTNTNTVYAAYVSYVWDYGQLATPIAGVAGKACEVVSVHAPVCLKVVNWCCQAYDTSPKQPDPDTGSSNEILKLKAIGAPFQSEMADGTIVRTIAGVYIYILLVPPSDTDSFTIGTPPYDGSLWNVINPSDFITGLLGPSAAPSGSGPYGGQS